MVAQAITGALHLQEPCSMTRLHVSARRLDAASWPEVPTGPQDKRHAAEARVRVTHVRAGGRICAVLEFGHLAAFCREPAECGPGRCDARRAGPVAGIAGERRDKDRVGQLPAALV